MTVQVNHTMRNGMTWHAVSDSGPGVGPSILIPIETLPGMNDGEILEAIRSGVEAAERASAHDIADWLLCYKKEDSSRSNKRVADTLRLYPDKLQCLSKFQGYYGAYGDIDEALEYAHHCLAYYPVKPVTPKVNKTPGVRAELQRKYHETFVKLGRRDGFICQYCGSSDGDLQIDHVHPVSKGGTNDIDNLQLLCAACNLAKSDTVAEVEL